MHYCPFEYLMAVFILNWPHIQVAPVLNCEFCLVCCYDILSYRCHFNRNTSQLSIQSFGYNSILIFFRC